MAPDHGSLDACDSLYVSPHADDVLLSCPGQIVSDLDAGLRVAVLTVFSSRGASEAGAEAILDHFGIGQVSLGLPEAASRHASYGDFTGLTAARRPEDAGAVSEAADALADARKRSRARHVYVPLGVGGHVDHRLCQEAALRSFESGDGRNVFLYEDRPDALVRGAVRIRLAQLGAGLPPGAASAADDTSLAAYLMRFHVGPSLRGDMSGWVERARAAGAAARMWRESRWWKPGKGGFGPRLQPVIHAAEADALPRMRTILAHAAATSRAAERIISLAARYAKRLGAPGHAERLWLLLPQRAEGLLMSADLPEPAGVDVR